MKLWAGRFSKEVSREVNDFNSSISFDSKMYLQDIQGSIAHATMLGEVGIIEKSEAQAIVNGLAEILTDIEDGKLEIDPTAEDIHSFVEFELTKRIGDAGKRLHTARSRNDQVALDIRMYLKIQIFELKDKLTNLINLLCDKADEHKETIMPGYTHLQRAQPITFAHHLMAYAQMFLRDLDRLNDCFKRLNELPLGAGALAGTTYNIDRDFVAMQLGFIRPTTNSLDSVADRDFCVELAFDISLIMTHLSRFSEEIILWCSTEFKFVELDDAYATGSSIMPQKKNPDVTELIRGKTGRVFGDLVALLTMLKGLPLAYNKDMQEDKEAIFDSVETVAICIDTFIPMLDTMTVLKDNMRAAAAKGFINATDCADYLVKKGLPFRDAYKAVGTIVAYCIENDKTLETLSVSEYKEICDIFEDDVYDYINLEACVNERKSKGGPAPEAVAEQIEYTKTRLDELQ
ncbi:MAG: argininosuccinate lyase [Oscillospiraceae bacterium]|nr:argininosuccinate lyase [Oscillospiraceae bacterium]